MTQPGSDVQPLRVAVIGSGPAGFYVAEHLYRRKDLQISVDMYDRLPTPYGLVRFGVAPDHEKIKNVTRAFDKVAARPSFRFYGAVDVGKDLTLDELTRFYHQICFTTGAQTDRRMGIDGEDLERSHAATEFVAWYNGHPDFRNRRFDLSVQRVAVVGVGNVAVDVARILCRTPEELAKTDIADYALDALRRSRVREVYMLGRRGPAQGAFTNPEVRELGDMPGADVAVLPEEAELDPDTRAQVEADADRTTLKKIEIIQGFAHRNRTGKPRVLVIRFLVSPVELIGNQRGEVVGMRLVRNELCRMDDGSLRPRPTGHFEDLPVELVFRSVGYRGVALPGLPFDERRGIVPNERGRVVNPETQHRVQGVYVAGWIKRGPTGVIGTNKPDADETVAAMIEDLGASAVLHPEEPTPAAVESLIRARKPDYISYESWLRLKQIETDRGKAQGRPRVKCTSFDEIAAALGE